MTLFVFGDSITKGVVFDETRGRYHNLSQNFLARYAELTQTPLRNYSIFGATIAKGQSMVERYVDDILPGDRVLLMYGGNDCNFDWKGVSEQPEAQHEANTPLESFRDSYRQMIATLKAKTSNIVLSALPPLEYQRFFKFCTQGLNQNNILRFLGDEHHIYRWQEMYHMVVCNLANEFDLKLLDLRLPFLSRDNYSEYYCIDGMHPNQKGQELMLRAALDHRRKYGLTPENR